MTVPISHARMPAVGPAPAAPAPKRVEFSSLTPQTPAGEYIDALVAAGWKFDISTLSVINGKRSAKLESLPYDLQAWLAIKGHRPPPTRLRELQEDVMRLALERLPKTGGLLQ